MHRLTCAMSIAVLSSAFCAGSVLAEAPLLSNRCLDDPALCSGDSALAPGEARVRSISAIASADDGPLLLTNRDLGASTDELSERAAEPEAKPEPVEMAAVVDEPASEEAADADAAPAPVEEPEEAAEEMPPVVGSEFSADEAGVAHIEDPMDFEDCMESSIRAGNEFGESQRVCGAVFPE